MEKLKCAYEGGVTPSGKRLETYYFSSESDAQAFHKAYEEAKAKAIKELIPEVIVFDAGSEDKEEWAVEVVTHIGDLTEKIDKTYFSVLQETLHIEEM
jgi:hypothetical protein